MPANRPVPTPTTRLHLARLDAALGALASGLARLLDELESGPTSLDPPTDAGLSVPAGERPAPVTRGEATTYGRSA